MKQTITLSVEVEYDNENFTDEEIRKAFDFMISCSYETLCEIHNPKIGEFQIIGDACCDTV